MLPALAIEYLIVMLGLSGFVDVVVLPAVPLFDSNNSVPSVAFICIKEVKVGSAKAVQSILHSTSQGVPDAAAGRVIFIAFAPIHSVKIAVPVVQAYTPQKFNLMSSLAFRLVLLTVVDFRLVCAIVLATVTGTEYTVGTYDA